ncbi:YXWGXW repeat-containing protein [Telmatobacter bradus]|uniref:YXWGXW repeat-containing protein n=1 Tax=Telmatobacter bradus TaxID=474953 RepID=UPI003B42CBC0
MKKFCSLRVLFLGLLFSLVPASSFAGVFISVGIAPPALPVYDVPPCPEPGWMWTPGYWAYGADGYYWVPGAWVPAPNEGALWTPGYWGWGEGVYLWHPGYWGPHVGYYGGVNYGGGYLGIGFAGGMWHGHDFVYNTAAVRVGPSIHNTYINKTVIVNNTVVNNNHVSFNGGPGGINHSPMAQERMAEHEQHMGASNFQQNHQSAAMADHGSYARNNGGRPSNTAMARPMGYSNNANQGGQGFGGAQHSAQPQFQQQHSAQPQYQQQQRSAQPQYQQQQQQRSAQPQYQQQQRSAQPQHQQQQRSAQPQYQQQQHSQQQSSQSHAQPQGNNDHAAKRNDDHDHH